MSYLNINIDNLFWEIKSLIKNNYGCFELKSFENHFELAKRDIIKQFEEILNKNKEEIYNDLKEEFEEPEELESGN